MYPMEKESTNLEQGDRSITGMKVNANLPQKLQKKTAEPEEKQPERRLRMIQNPERNYRRPKTTLNKNPEKRCNDTTTVSVIARQLEQMKLNEDQEIPRNPKKRKQ
ncbi:hypothetical protein V8E54_013636 [Elaphomyces granulatus]